MNKNMNFASKRAVAMLATLVLAAPLAGPLPSALQKSPLALSVAQAQRRPQARDYNRNELSQLTSVTRRGEISSNPNKDYFEMRGDDRKSYRVLARENVSLRGFKTRDFVEVSGRIDGDVLIAHSIRKVDSFPGNTLPGRQEVLRGTVSFNSTGNEFTMRHQGRTHRVVVQGKKPFGLHPNREVEVRGVSRNGYFYATDVQIIDGRSQDWQNRNERRLQGTVMDGDARYQFRLRLDDGRIVQVSSMDRSAARISRNNYVEVQGRWDNQRGYNDIFRAESVRILNRTGPGGRDYDQGHQVDFVGRVVRSSSVGRNSWDLTVQSDQGTYSVLTDRNFRTGTNIRVRGTLRGRIIITNNIETVRSFR